MNEECYACELDNCHGCPVMDEINFNKEINYEDYLEEPNYNTDWDQTIEDLPLLPLKTRIRYFFRDLISKLTRTKDNDLPF